METLPERWAIRVAGQVGWAIAVRLPNRISHFTG